LGAFAFFVAFPNATVFVGCFARIEFRINLFHREIKTPNWVLKPKNTYLFPSFSFANGGITESVSHIR
jgi:hypothetical protein